MGLILDGLYLATGLILTPQILYRMAFYRRYRTGWSERLGLIRPRGTSGPCVWLHAVSLGEVNASRTIISALRQARSDLHITISSTTDTGYARAKALFSEQCQVIHMPLDISCFIRQAFERIRPTICILMELEVWPHMVKEAASRHIPVVVVNGRISDRSYRKYLLARPLLRTTFQRLHLALVQTELYAQRFRALGCKEVIVTGLLKFDTALLDQQIDGSGQLQDQLNLTGSRLWVAGGTGDGEEVLVLEAYRQLKADTRMADLRLAIVPRRPERFQQVADLIRKAGLPLVRYSQVLLGKCGQIPKDAVVLGDTIGDLRKFYSIASVIFVGRSLVPMGGSDMIEAAALGRPTIFGPYVDNFRHPAEILVAAGGAIQVKDRKGLSEAVARCLLDSDLASSMGQRARSAIRSSQGATAKTLEHILALLKPAP